MSFLSDFKASFTGEPSQPQEVEMNPLQDAWSSMKATASSVASNAKKTSSNFKIPVPTSEEDVTLESTWSKMTKSAAAAANSAKKSVAPIAATAGIDLSVNDETEGDEENLMSGAASGAANELNEELKGICPSLTYKQRIYGALACIGLGLVLDIFASLAFWMGKAHVADYAVHFFIDCLYNSLTNVFIYECRFENL